MPSALSSSNYCAIELRPHVEYIACIEEELNSIRRQRQWHDECTASAQHFTRGGSHHHRLLVVQGKRCSAEWCFFPCLNSSDMVCTDSTYPCRVACVAAVYLPLPRLLAFAMRCRWRWRWHGASSGLVSSLGSVAHIGLLQIVNAFPGVFSGRTGDQRKAGNMAPTEVFVEVLYCGA